jgi:starvation-inducible DNA-binding protein
MSSVTDKLIQLQADSHILYIKVHNFHWNVKGLQFFGIHRRMEEIYNFLGTQMDDLAERALQLGATPVVTLKQTLEKTKLQEEEKTDLDPIYVLESVLKDYEYLAKEFRELATLADGDSTTTMFAEDKIAHFEKQIWMLKATRGK